MILFDNPSNRCYMVDPDSAKSTTDRIGVIGYQKILPGEKYPKEGFPDICLFKEHGGRYINEYQLIYIASGSGIFQDRGIHYKVHSGQFMLIQPGYWHSYTPNPDTGWEEYYIGFNGTTLALLAQEIFKISEINLLKVSNTDFILPLFFAALKIGAGEDTAENLLLRKALLTQLLIDVRQALKNNDSLKESLVFKTRQYMEENLSRKVKIDDIASHLCVSNSWFRKEFQRLTGVPPATFLGRIRLQTSKYLLLSSNKSIKEIAAQCGFVTSEYFCKCFRDNTGMTPSDFREHGHPGATTE